MFNKLKSNDSDFSSLQHDPFLDLMNKNILYLTHTIDKVLVVLKKLELQQQLQTQVDDYYDSKSTPNEDAKNIPLEDMAQDGNSTGN